MKFSDLYYEKPSSNETLPISLPTTRNTYRAAHCGEQVLDLSAAGTNNLTFLLETKGVLEQLEILDLESRTIMKKWIFVCMTTSRDVRKKTRDIESQ